MRLLLFYLFINRRKPNRSILWFIDLYITSNIALVLVDCYSLLLYYHLRIYHHNTPHSLALIIDWQAFVCAVCSLLWCQHPLAHVNINAVSTVMGFVYPLISLTRCDTFDIDKIEWLRKGIIPILDSCVLLLLVLW